MKQILILICIFAVLNKCESIVIDCGNFGGHPYYTCYVKNDQVPTSEDSRDITGIRGNHSIGKTDDDVTHFAIYGKTANFFPRGITKYFKNINYVSINNANLIEISKEDLKEFGDKLKELYLQFNKIEVIEADLFTYNKNLQLIDLRVNKIKHIDDGAFDHLKNLNQLILHENPCTPPGITADAKSRSEVMKLIKTVEEKCKDHSYAFLQGKNDEIKKLREENEKLKDENKKLKEKCQVD
jgi:hypothetical protein